MPGVLEGQELLDVVADGDDLLGVEEGGAGGLPLVPTHHPMEEEGERRTGQLLPPEYGERQ